MKLLAGMFTLIVSLSLFASESLIVTHLWTLSSIDKKIEFVDYMSDFIEDNDDNKIIFLNEMASNESAFLSHYTEENLNLSLRNLFDKGADKIYFIASDSGELIDHLNANSRERSIKTLKNLNLSKVKLSGGYITQCLSNTIRDLIYFSKDQNKKLDLELLPQFTAAANTYALKINYSLYKESLFAKSFFEFIESLNEKQYKSLLEAIANDSRLIQTDLTIEGEDNSYTDNWSKLIRLNFNL